MFLSYSFSSKRFYFLFYILLFLFVCFCFVFNGCNALLNLHIKFEWFLILVFFCPWTIFSSGVSLSAMLSYYISVKCPFSSYMCWPLVVCSLVLVCLLWISCGIVQVHSFPKGLFWSGNFFWVGALYKSWDMNYWASPYDV